MDTKELILDFIKNEKLAVISTVGIDNKPESAVIGFGQSDKLELVFDTYNTSRKYKNLMTNKNVSFVIGWDEAITVQYEGIAEELEGEEKKRFQMLRWEKDPKSERWATREGITYFKVIPKWIRISDLKRNPWDINEVSF